MKHVFVLDEPRIPPVAVVTDDEWSLTLSNGETITPALSYNFTGIEGEEVMLTYIKMIPRFTSLPAREREVFCNTFGLCEESIDAYLLILTRYVFPPVENYIPLASLIEPALDMVDYVVDEDDNEYVYVSRGCIGEFAERTADNIIQLVLNERDLIHSFEKIYMSL